MVAVLVTGGTGSLGRFLVSRLVADGHEVRSLSRRPEPPGWRRYSWVTADLYAGGGVARAVRGVDAIVHCSTALGRKDVAITRRLLDAASASGTPHLVQPSIVGSDRIPLGHNRTKVESSGLALDGAPHGRATDLGGPETVEWGGRDRAGVIGVSRAIGPF